MTEPKKLIEVAMPVKEVSAESVRDKSIRHGHISTLHLWWARRPLPVCRAVVFASLVPDPLDENCPAAFKQAVAKYLAGKEYKPYDDIPHTAAIDPMEDNLRNRLLMFIGKFSEDYIANEKIGKSTDSKKQLSDGSLIKWENKNNPKIIGIARKLIFIAHQTSTKSGAEGFSPKLGEMSAGQRGENATLPALEILYDQLWTAITTAEQNLYSTPNRHIGTNEVKAKEQALHEAIEKYLDKMPRVFDPFAGGGAIPLEAARLGCRTFGNDLNPVAHIIQRGSVEFPQKYGKPITYTRDEFLKQYPVFAEVKNMNVVAEPKLNYGFTDKIELENYDDAISKHSNIQDSSFIILKNRLAFDVEYYARKMLAGAEEEIGHLYPKVTKNNNLAYYWSRVGKCNNPSCKAEIPLLKQFYLCNKSDKKIYLNPTIRGIEITFEIKEGVCQIEGFVQNRKSLKCPCCGNVTSNNELKEQFNNEGDKIRLLAVIEEENGKRYRLPTEFENNLALSHHSKYERPPEVLPVKNKKQFDVCPWGYTTYGSLFTERQLTSIWTFILQLKKIEKDELFNNYSEEYTQALVTYLAIWIDRLVQKGVSFLVWDTGYEKISNLFGRQALAMVFDFVESNPFCGSTGSALNQLQWLTLYCKSEGIEPFHVDLLNSGSGEKNQFKENFITATITDPPYYDAIAYGDLSDFFYVWLKRILPNYYPLNFATPLTPKAEECTALKYYHNDSIDNAKKHFEIKLSDIFDSIEFQTRDFVSIMFAHQSTEAWTTLCNSILNSRMNITGSWSLDSEYTNTGLKLGKSFLSSSVTVGCRPSIKHGTASFKVVKNAIILTISKQVSELYNLGFRGADLLTACFGQAVSEFGKFSSVEKADGSNITIEELLNLARDAAFNAIISDIDADEVTRFYIGWLNLFGFTPTEHDDVMRITQVGLSVEVNELQQHNIFESLGSTEILSGYKERCKANQKLGTQANSFAIDRVHKAMSLFESGNRAALTEYLGQVAPTNDASFWRICTALAEVLPPGCDDYKQLTGLLTNKESLIREAQRRKQETPEQGTLGL